MLAVDAAEAQGDATGALAIIEDMPVGPDGRPWWRPERVRRLRQLATLGDDAPEWVIRRWVVAQAAQARPGRPREACDVAVRTRGGGSTLWGVDHDDAMSKVIDHDWVYRQLVLHEHGGLAAFVDGAATPALLGLAGDMRSWTGVPMGGFELMAETSDRIVWRDLASSQTIETLNLGGAAMLAIGEAVIGRLVSAGDVHLFESAPLCVPIDVARDVAASPSRWVELLGQACRGVHREVMSVLVARMHHFDLLFDLPATIRRQLIEPPDAELRSDQVGTGGNGVEYDVALVLAAMSGELQPDDIRCTCGACDDPRPAGALVAAAVLEPDTLDALAPLLVPSDAAALQVLEQTLVTPADVVCRRIRESLDVAA
jgi:hypothetical protein